MATRSDAVDARADRAVQGALAIVVLAAFVFHQAWVIPVLGVLVAFGAILGPAGNPFHRVYTQLFATRLPAATAWESAATVRAQDVLAVALLGVATLALLLGIGVIAWVTALIEAGVAVVAATTGVHVGEMALDQLRRHR